MAATALLHLAGIGIGFVIRRAGERYGQVLVRSTGGLVAVTGIGILTALI